MKVYETVIEICLNPVFNNASRRDEETLDELREVYGHYFRPVKAAPTGITTQERALIGLFCDRASHEHRVARENGYIGAFHNCVLQLLYGVFGVDIIKFLFDKAWVPRTNVDPFRPMLFLERLSVLERAAKLLKDGTKTPLPLLDLKPYVQSGMGPRLMCFCEKNHRLLLTYSLRELRDFGELGLSLQQQGEKPTVWVSIYWPYAAYHQEILRFASEEFKSAG